MRASCLFKLKTRAWVLFVHRKTRALRTENNRNGVTSWSHSGSFSSNCIGSRCNQQLQLFWMCITWPRLVACIQNVNKPVALYPHGAICKSIGCCCLCCCSSNYGLVAIVKWREEAVVGTIMTSKMGRQECLPKPTTRSRLSVWATAVAPCSNGWRKKPSVTLPSVCVVHSQK